MEDHSILDTEEQVSTAQQQNVVLQVFCILGYISNGFWIMFLSLSLILGSAVFMQMAPELNELDEETIRLVYWVMSLMLLINISALVGLIFAHKRKRFGAILYGISNGLWALFIGSTLEPMNIFLSALSIGFIIVIALNYHK
jgi:hypothetical protein